MDRKTIIAACGNDCAACPRRLPKTEEALRRTAELWAKIGYRDRVVSNEAIACTGCKPTNWCRYGIAECVAARKIAHCGKCPEYPCRKLEACFEATEGFRAACLNACASEEWRALETAFFEKRKNLDAARRIIGTERLILRPYWATDAQDGFEILGDPEVNRYIVYPLHRDIEDTREYIQEWDPDEDRFAIELKATGKVVGACMIWYNDEEGGWELACGFNRLFWGKGYATEITKALIGWAYDVKSARDFIIIHAVGNPASGRVARKCGFTQVHAGKLSRMDGSETFPAIVYKMHLD